MAVVLSKSIRMTASPNFIKKATDRIQKNIEKKLKESQNEAETKLKTLVTDAVSNHPVYKGIKGDFAGDTDGSDLQAEFGLTKTNARLATKILLDILRQQCQVQIKREGQIHGYVPIIIKYEALSSKKYESAIPLSSEPFTYTSYKFVPESDEEGSEDEEYEGQATEIPWMKMILRAGNSDPASMIEGVKKYGISYKMTRFGKLISRSGRALMRPLRKRSKKGVKRNALSSWKFPSFARPRMKGSKNFLQDIALDPRFKALVAKQIEKMVYKVVKPRNKLPIRLKG